MKFPRICPVLLAVAMALTAAASEGAPETGTRLHYLVLSGKTEVAPPFAAVDFVYGPVEKGKGRWWQLEIRAKSGLTNAPLCAVRGLTAEDPLSEKADGLHFDRYQL